MNELKNHFCTFEQSQSLKELGFLGGCDYLFKVEKIDNEEFQQRIRMPFDNTFTNRPKDTNIACPMKSQAFEFFRKKFGFLGSISSWSNGTFHFTYKKVVGDIHSLSNLYHTQGHFETYHQAESACIDRLIELAKQQIKG